MFNISIPNVTTTFTKTFKWCRIRIYYLGQFWRESCPRYVVLHYSLILNILSELKLVQYFSRYCAKLMAQQARYKFFLAVRLFMIRNKINKLYLKCYWDEKNIYPILILVNYNYEMSKTGVLGFSEYLISFLRYLGLWYI